MHPIKVLLAENSPLLREALAPRLHRMGFAVTVTVPGPTSRRSNKVACPEVVLLDTATIGRNPQRLEELVLQHSHVAPVLLLAGREDFELIAVGLKAGAAGILEHPASEKDLQGAIVAVASGKIFCDARTFHKIMRLLPPLRASHSLTLTKREEQVLALACRGESNKEIAQHLALSQQSVKVYVSHLLQKTGAPSRSGLALYTAAPEPVNLNQETKAPGVPPENSP
ncbi:MAG TPA: response regulator transcription factor [Candidatus Acidoferrales bacterium]